MEIINTILPLQTVPQGDWTESYYKKCVQSIASNWGNYNTAGMNSFLGNWLEMWQCYQTFQMQQGGQNTVWMREPMPGMIANAQYIPGGITTSIVNYHVGAVSEFLNNIEVTANSLSSDVVNSKTMHYDAIMFQYNMGSLAKELAEMGVMFKTQLPPRIAEMGEAQVKRFARSSFLDENEKAATVIAKAAMEENKYKEQFRRQAEHLLISGIAAMHIDNDNPHLIPKWKEIPSMFLMKDRRVDSDSGMYDEYTGYIQYMPVSQVVAKYNLDEDDAKWLQTQASSTQQQLYWNGIYGFPVFSQTAYGCSVAVIRCWWHSYKDSRYTSRTDSYGVPHVKLLSPDDARNGKFWTPTVRCGDLIAGKILRNAGEMTNLTINSVSGLPNLPVVDTIPQMMFGRSRSMVSKLRAMEEYRDNVWAKLQQHIAEDYGHVMTFDTSMATKGTPSTYDVKQKMAELRIIEYNGAEREGMRGSGVGSIDAGLTPNVMYYLNILDKCEMDMRTVVATSLPTQGLQSSTIGKGVMDNTIAANTRGNLYWMNALYEHYNQIIQQTADQVRINLASYENEDVPLVTDGQLQMIKNTKELSFSKIGTRLRVDDLTPMQKKNLLVQVAMGWANSGQVSADAVLDVLDAETYKKGAQLLREDYEKMVQEKREAAQQQAQYQQQLEQMKAQKDMGVAQTYADSTQNTEAMKQQGLNEREAANMVHERNMEGQNNE